MVATNTAPLTRFAYLSRVTVLGQPGTVRYHSRDGAVAVQLDGEGNRTDLWHPSHVVAAEVTP